MRRSLLIAVALLAFAPAAAQAHAQLEGTTPERGAVVRTQPQQIVFRFSESVEGAFGSVRVFDARARRVDDGRVVHPGGAGARLAVGLRPGLPNGTYTATYRVVSADGHPVSGGVVFSVGRAGAGPAQTIDQLIGASRAGPVTRAAQRATHAVQYLATALAVGLIAFWLWCLPTAVRPPAGPRARRLLLVAANAGLATSALGVVLEGAIATGTTFWSALDPDTIDDVLSTRFGGVWRLRAIVWLGVVGLALVPRPGRRTAAAAVVLAGLLVLAPAFEGHSATLSPTGLLVAADVVHVLAMSLWIGGIVALLVVLPRATRAIDDQGARTQLLASVLGRFSPVALGAVLALAVTGAAASVAFLTSLSQLWDTGYGRELLAKIVLLILLAGLGAVNRRRVIPALRRARESGDAPGRAGAMLRRTLRAEVALLLAVLGISGVLVDGVPPVSAASGPFSVSKRLGPLDLEVTVDPARVGPNTMHVYLLTARTGAPFDRTKQLTATAALGAKRIGPLPITLRRSGPGHFTADAFQLAPGGRWTIAVTDRVSAFDEYRTTFEVPVR